MADMDQKNSDNADAGEGEDNFHDNHFEKLCSNDKVIQSIHQLINQTEDESKQKKKDYREFAKEHKAISSECDQLKK